MDCNLLRLKRIPLQNRKMSNWSAVLQNTLSLPDLLAIYFTVLPFVWLQPHDAVFPSMSSIVCSC